jgi:acetolactate synthase-1/2/3 large subunit
MQQTRTRAIQSLKGGRSFSTSAQRPAVSPFKRPAQAAASKVLKEDVKRTQSTAAAAATQTQQRARPAPAFNREDYNVQPLKPYRSPEMDHSFVGMTGGEIFHEMMLRQGVKHICMTHFLQLSAIG